MTSRTDYYKSNLKKNYDPKNEVPDIGVNTFISLSKHFKY